ncbi:hypothetical protein P148_SR1C00001G0683 [candidate division SR1 bacterium RAAC1_SR1_1]|nr:hypothetical protein P148_SR1C00001G0683 [candidate division SR1 bacterium RAAC1_SR1_1]
MASHVIVQEIINDIIAIDPDLKNIKSELEKLVQELIANKPQTPFTKEFKESLKAQIIGAINEQKILYEEKKRDRNEMFHSLKFWMVGVSTVTAGLLIFTLFYYLEDIQQPATQVTYIGETKEKETTPLQDEIREIQPTIRSLSMDEETPTDTQGGGASNSADNVMMLAIPEANEEPATDNTSLVRSSEEYEMMAKFISAPVEEATNADMAIAEITTDETSATKAPSPTFCETSKQFLIANNISENTTKTITYENQIYKTTTDFTNNMIMIDHIGTQDDSKIETELPNLNLFFKNNNFNVESEYSSPIIEETDTYFEYYYPRHNNQEGITVRINKINNIIFSVQNICIY